MPSGGITRQPGGVPGDSWTWQDSEDISALVDSERYLAHVIEIAGRWLAFDATHRNDSGRGFAFLGARDSLVEAKDLVESALRGERVRSAVVDTNNVQPLPRLAATLEEAALHLEWASLGASGAGPRAWQVNWSRRWMEFYCPLLSRIGGRL